jgi:hypothetical protein
MRQTTEKPVDWFKEDNLREHYDDDELRPLGESLLVRQIHDVIARPDGVTVDGVRRLRAAKLVGKKTLNVVITDEPLTQPLMREIQFVSAFHRAALTGWEQYQGLRTVQEAHPDWRQQDLADHLHVDAKMVRVMLSPGDCIPEIQAALRARKLGISDVYAMSLVDPERQVLLLAKKLAGASRDALARESRKHRGGPCPALRVNKIKCVLPSGVTLTVSGEELGMNEFFDVLTDVQKEAKKAKEEGLDIKTFAAVMRDKAKAAV